MSVKLVLLEDVADLGRIGQVVSVAPGYARNYLVPRHLATVATPGILRQIEAKKKRLHAQYEAEKATAQAYADKLSQVSVTIAAQADETEALYGSITAQQIVDGLAEMEHTVDRKAVELADPIKQLGVFDVPVRLHPDVVATIKVWVVKA